MKLEAIALTAVLSGMLPAQTPAPKRSLNDLLRDGQARIEAASQSEDPKAFEKTLEKFCGELRSFMTHEAKGNDVYRARFELVQALMSGGKRGEAQATLKAFPAKTAPSLMCANAAYLADTIGMKNEYEGFTAIAVAKAKSFADRMELGVHLMSTLRKPALGSKIYADAFAAAKNDEERATVRWHEARATREREDIPESVYEQMLHKLATDFPKTRFGSIAGDRLRAMDFEIGAAPILFTVETLTGETWKLAAQKGKAVLVLFWASDVPRSKTAIDAVNELVAQHGARGLVAIGVSLDLAKANAKAAATRWKIGFPAAYVEGGFEAELALRYRVEDVPFAFLVGKDGKIAGLNFVLHDEFGRKQVTDAVVGALR